MADAGVERNLIFALLAIQNHFIDQTALVAAFHAWNEDRRRSMAELLKAQGALTDSRATLLDALVEEHIRQHGNNTQESLAALSGVSSASRRLAEGADPDIAASLSLVGTAARSSEEEQYEGGLTSWLKTKTYSVGGASSGRERFRILRPHRQGGLGAVYIALDVELQREVALKEIQEGHSKEETSRARFVREAEITGNLEHPGIVPVYGLGQYADGRPYYAMRFIRGDSLRDAIAAFHRKDGAAHDPQRRSLELRKLLRRFLDVCNAIHYAHNRGVLHRDLKPGNIMVGRYGETLVVDWGLAKPIGRAEGRAELSEEATLRPSPASGSVETISGSAVGTPGYMSPEQASGRLQDLGPASDVFSLGTTLYCLLTGHAPFEDRDLGRILERTCKGDFPPPRQHARWVSKALEAICLKAMALRPHDRYLTAEALAEEIEKWLADDPVSAYPEPYLVRARRWARRHKPLVAGGLAAILVALAGISIAVVTRVQRLTQIRGNAEEMVLDALQEANAGNLDRAISRLSQASGIYRGEPSLASLGRRLERQVGQLEQYRRFQKLAREALRSSAHMFHFDRSDRSRDLGRCQNALAEYHVIEDANWTNVFQDSLLKPAQIEEVREQAYQLLMTLAMLKLITKVDDTGREQSAREMLVLLDRANALRPRSTADAILRMLALRRLGDNAGADREGELAQSLKPESVSDLFILGSLELGVLEQKDAARAIFKRVLQIQPGHYGANLGLFLCDEPTENVADHLVPLSICLTLNPDDPVLYYFRGFQYFALGRYQEAEADFNQSVLHDPTYATGYFYRGRMKIAQARWPEALADLDLAQKYDPTNKSVYDWRGIARAKNGDPDGAAEDAEEALKLGAGKPLTYYYAARAYAQAVGALSSSSDSPDRDARVERFTDRSLEILEQGVKLGFDDFDRLQPGGDFDPVRSDPRFQPILDRQSLTPVGDP